MAQQQYVSIIEEMLKKLQHEEHEVGYQITTTEDRISFGFPAHLTIPMSEQLQAALRAPGQGKVPQEFKPNSQQKQDIKDPANKKNLQLPASSTIQQAAYWPGKNYLVVSFKSGHTYDYSDVPLLTVLQWEQAASAGSWFYYNIRMSFSYRKLG